MCLRKRWLPSKCGRCARAAARSKPAAPPRAADRHPTRPDRNHPHPRTSPAVQTQQIALTTALGRPQFRLRRHAAPGPHTPPPLPKPPSPSPAHTHRATARAPLRGPSLLQPRPGCGMHRTEASSTPASPKTPEHSPSGQGHPEAAWPGGCGWIARPTLRGGCTGRRL